MFILFGSFPQSLRIIYFLLISFFKLVRSGKRLKAIVDSDCCIFEQFCGRDMLPRLDCVDFGELIDSEIVLIRPEDFGFYLNPIFR